MKRPDAHRALAAAVLFGLAACGGGYGGNGDGGNGGGNGNDGGNGNGGGTAFCETKQYTPPRDSPYQLPYAVGSTFAVIQGNCPPDPRWGHYGRFGYDFDMPLGTPVHAMRAGAVIYMEDRYQNGDHTPGHENGVWIEHADGTIADYVHLSPSSVLVRTGEEVRAGDLLGYSGDTGYSAGPHLHVETLADDSSFGGENTTPLTFRNADGPLGPNGELTQGGAYTALPAGD